MELRQIQSFITITQMQSFSKAGELLGYSQSAISVQIRLLEKELNVRLFDRMGKKIALTPQGKQFLVHANNIIQETHKAKQLVKLQDELCNPLHIGTLASLCSSKLPPILHYFRQNHPKVPLRITTGTPKELIEMMESNQLDLIYLLDRPRYNNNWNKAMEAQEQIVFLSSPSYRLSEKKGILLEELISEPFFLTEKGENYRRELDQFLESKGMTLTPFLEISNTEFIIRMINQHHGISFLPLFAVQKSVENQQLAILDVVNFHVILYRQIFYHKNKWETPEMQQFIQLAKLNLS